MPSGSTVRINVSQGRGLAGVPSVVGQPYANAASALQGAGFTVVARRRRLRPSRRASSIAQDPVAGRRASRSGSKVTLTVSKGPQTADVPT